MSDISSEPPLRLSLGDDRAVLIPSDLFARDTTPSNAAGRHDDITAYHHNTYHAEHHEPVSGEKVDTDFLDNPVFISPQKVDDLKRFRMLFVGTLLLIVSSTQGLHSVFGVLLMQKLYLYSAKDMMTVYMWGCIVGMFVFPFGFMYDWLGPRPVIIVCTLLAAAGHTLFALMFRGDIEHTVHNSSCFYGLMCWGCYGLQVAVLPSMLTHMPRDRGQPTALLQTFSGLGASFFACIFRGFFNNHFDHLMWLMVTITLFFGAIGTWYVHDAPYITNRWQQLSLTPHAQLQKLLIRNRYASQLVPKRRFAIVTMILVALNFYLTIQTVTVAYLADDMTKAKYRGIACGAIVLTFCCSILAFPFDVIDGVTIQDKAVLRSAQEKSEKLMQSRELGEGEESHHPLHSSHHHDDNDNNNGDNGEEEKKTDTSGSGEHESGSQQQHLHGEEETVIASETRYALISPNRHLIEATPTALGEDANIMTTTAAVVGNNVLDTHVTATPQLLSRENSAALLGFSNHASVVGAIHVCGEVYVAPVYQTTFLQSLTYMDLWLMMYTTMVMWGIGLVITGNWNIQVMSASRFTALDYKTYILFSAVSGVCTASGRVFISIYEVILRVLRERYGLVCASTIGYPIASVGLFLSLIVWIVLPDNKSLVVAYIIMPYFYGMNSSMTIYVLGTIFDRDLGMHYGFCFLGASIGVILFYYLAWFLPFDDASTNIPFLGRMCLKHRRCMSTTVGIYIAAVFTAILSSYIVHRRYARLVAGQLKHRRVLRRALRRILGRA